VGDTYIYQVKLKDPEGYAPLDYYDNSDTLPSYFNFYTANNTYVFKPPYTLEPETLELEVCGSDTVNEDCFNFDVNILNDIPTFNTSLVDQKIAVGTSALYLLPVTTILHSSHNQ
jgi:hypothetical protein